MARNKRDPETGIRLQDYERGEYLPIQPGDAMQTVLQSGIDTIRREIQTGRPSTYENTPAGLKAFMEATERYFETIRNHNANLEEGQRGMIADIEGWCISLGISRVTLMHYSQRGGNWARFIELAKDVIGASKKAAANDYRTPPVFTIFDLKCNHGYVEKSELKLTTDAREDEAAALQDAADEAGLIWDEQRHEYITVEGDAI